MPERLPIVGVAIRFNDELYVLSKPNRHHDVIRHIIETTGVIAVDNDEQGFVDSAGRFLNRKQALINAELHGQLIKKTAPESMLFSEDLW